MFMNKLFDRGHLVTQPHPFHRNPITESPDSPSFISQSKRNFASMLLEPRCGAAAPPILIPKIYPCFLPLFHIEIFVFSTIVEDVVTTCITNPPK